MANENRVKIKALKAPKDKPQHMVEGNVYEVGEKTAEHLIKHKWAEKTNDPVTKRTANVKKSNKADKKKGEDLTT